MAEIEKDRSFPISESKTPRTDREVYRVKECDIGFEVVNPALCREFEEKLAEVRNTVAKRCVDFIQAFDPTNYCGTEEVIYAIKQEFDLE